MVHHTTDTILDVMKHSVVYFLPDICTLLYHIWDHIYIILWPTLNEMEQFEHLVE